MTRIMFLSASLAVVSTGVAVATFMESGYRGVWLWLIDTSASKREVFEKWQKELSTPWTDRDIELYATVARVSVLAAFLIVLVSTQSIEFAAVAAWAAYRLPLQIFEHRARARRDLLESELPDAVDTMVATIRSGASLTKAIGEVCEKMPRGGPVNQEFGKMLSECTVGGLSIEQSLARARRRVHSDTFKMISSALIISVEQGGDILHILERMAEASRSLMHLRQKIESEVSGIRSQQKIIMAMTPLFLLMVCSIHPGVWDALFHTIPGRAIIIGVVFLMYGCVAWIGRIVRSAV